MVKTQSTYREAIELSIRGFSTAMRMTMVSATILALLVCTTVSAQTLDKVTLDQFFDRLAEKKKAMGSLTIARDGDILYTRSIGYSQINGTERTPLTAATRYRVGSTTKMFTAVMIFQLVEKGTLKLSDPLGKFFPQIPNAHTITIAHILAHRSGLHEVSSDPEFRAWRLKGITKDDMLALIAKSTPDFEPDDKYSYSNAGYFLLGYIVEKLTGKSYQEVLQERITAKIGLQDTYTGTGNIDVNKNESFSYKFSRDWEPQPETHVSILFGSGALISTPNDLAVFIQALFDGKLVSRESLKQMMQNKFGMDTFTYNGNTLYGHTGGVDGFGSWLVYLPEEKLVVSYATNGKVYPVANIIDAVFDIYWKKPFTIPTFESFAISPEVLDNYVGVYSNPEAPMKFTITRDAGTLYIEMAGKAAVPLEATAQETFRVESAGMVVEFDVAKKQMIIKRGSGEKVFTKEH